MIRLFLDPQMYQSSPFALSISDPYILFWPKRRKGWPLTEQKSLTFDFLWHTFDPINTFSSSIRHSSSKSFPWTLSTGTTVCIRVMVLEELFKESTDSEPDSLHFHFLQSLQRLVRFLHTIFTFLMSTPSKLGKTLYDGNRKLTMDT